MWTLLFGTISSVESSTRVVSGRRCCCWVFLRFEQWRQQSGRWISQNLSRLNQKYHKGNWETVFLWFGWSNKQPKFISRTNTTMIITEIIEIICICKCTGKRIYCVSENNKPRKISFQISLFFQRWLITKPSVYTDKSVRRRKYAKERTIIEISRILLIVMWQQNIPLPF